MPSPTFIFYSALIWAGVVATILFFTPVRPLSYPVFMFVGGYVIMVGIKFTVTRTAVSLQRKFGRGF